MNGRSELDRLFRAVADAQQPVLDDDDAVERAASALERHASAKAGPDARPRRRWTAWTLGFVVGTAATVTIVAAMARREPRPLEFVVGDGAAIAGRPSTPWRASSDPLALRFSDGSRVVVNPGSEAIVDRVGTSGADVRLAHGRLRADVQHTGRTAWRVSAGPFVVNVTGTQFSTAWQPAEGRFTVTLRQGRVVVEGAMLGDGVPLQPGQRLEAELASGRYTVSPIGTADEDAPPTAATSSAAIETPPLPQSDAVVATAPPRTAASWRALAGAGRTADAYESATRTGWERTCAQASAAELSELGDLARWARHPGRAKQAWTALLERFPNDDRAADAVFALGVIAAEDDRVADEAARLFRRYVEAWPTGVLAAAAAGRLLEAEQARGDVARTRAAAEEYLRRFPHGPHESLAQRVISESAVPHDAR